ncbi:MAG: hypothetical protein IKA58_00995, partial [Clostridia bacterium]|nr:hypothetical protein [Clostridia bacterium]
MRECPSSVACGGTFPSRGRLIRGRYCVPFNGGIPRRLGMTVEGGVRCMAAGACPCRRVCSCRENRTAHRVTGGSVNKGELKALSAVISESS